MKCLALDFEYLVFTYLFTRYLLMYQKDASTIPFMHHDLVLFLNNVLRSFNRDPFIDGSKSNCDLIKFKHGQIDKGLETAPLHKLTRKGQTSVNEVKNFKNSCPTFWSFTTGKLFEICSLWYVIVQVAAHVLQQTEVARN